MASVGYRIRRPVAAPYAHHDEPDRGQERAQHENGRSAGRQESTAEKTAGENAEKLGRREDPERRTTTDLLLYFLAFLKLLRRSLIL